MRAAYAQGYRTLWERHWWWRARESHVLDWVDHLRSLSQRDDFRILDVGCGDGLFFDQLGRFGRVEGIEPDASLVTHSIHREQIRTEALGVDFEVRSEHDLVLMLDVLEHVEDDLRALQSLRESLRLEGRLILTVPAISWLWSQHDQVNEHFRRYDRRSLANVLRSAGFEVESIGYFFMWTVVPMLIRRWLAPANDSTAPDYRVGIPPEPLNWALAQISRLEHRIGRWIPWPIGSSLLAVARPAPAL
jgi:SAM-dependent methyltransferase